VSKQAAAKTVAYLLTRGYLEQAVDKRDARRKLLTITDRGTDLLTTGQQLFDELRARWASRIGGAELDALQARLREIVATGSTRFDTAGCSPGRSTAEPPQTTDVRPTSDSAASRALLRVPPAEAAGLTSGEQVGRPHGPGTHLAFDRPVGRRGSVPLVVLISYDRLDVCGNDDRGVLRSQGLDLGGAFRSRPGPHFAAAETFIKENAWLRVP